MSKKKKTKKETNNKFNFDTDYFIGMNDSEKKKSKVKKKSTNNAKKKTLQKSKNTSKKKSTKKTTKNIDYSQSENFKFKTGYENTTNNASTKKIIEQEKKKQSKFKRRRIIVLIIFILIAITILLLSPIFNVKQIEVRGNEKVSSETIISVSEISLYKNMFLFTKNSAIQKIKEAESYIEDVKISRSFPDKIIIEVTERIPILQIELEDQNYAYIDNQGYVLEFSDKKLDLPLVTSIKTDLINLKTQDKTIRLDEDDLSEISLASKVISVMKEQELDSYIESFDISDKNNLVMTVNQGEKKVYLGDCSDLNTRILWLKEILEDTKDEKGEIFIDGILNEDYVYFREEI